MAVGGWMWLAMHAASNKAPRISVCRFLRYWQVEPHEMQTWSNFLFQAT